MKTKRVRLNKYVSEPIAVFLLAQVIILFSFIRLMQETYNNQIRDSLSYVLVTYKNNLEKIFENAERDLNQILSSKSSLMHLENKSDIVRWQGSRELLELMDTMLDFGIYTDVYVVLSQGKYPCRLAGRKETVSQQELERIEEYLEKHVGESADWHGIKPCDTVYLTKYFSYQGKLIAGLISQDSLNFYGGEISEAKNAQIHMIYSDGKICMSSEEQKEYGSFLSPDKDYITEKIGESLYLYGKPEDNQILQKSLSFYVIVVMLISSVFFLAVFFRIMKREIGIPIHTLEEVSLAIRRGEVDSRPVIYCRNEELNELTEAYCSMLDSIMTLQMKKFEEETRRKDAELKYMQMQLKPHFFLNALSTINNMSFQEKNQDIREFIGIFSENVRYMFKAGLNTITLKDELYSINVYLDLQRYFYGECFYSFIDAEEKVLEWQIPQLLLRIFVENIFKHAVDVSSFTSILIQCRIVSSEDGKSMLHIMIENSSGSFPEDVISEIRNGNDPLRVQRNGVGLKNAREILWLMYARSDLLKLENMEQEGTRVTLQIPEKAVLKDLRNV